MLHVSYSAGYCYIIDFQRICCSTLSMMFAQIRSIFILHVYHKYNSLAGIDPLSEFGEIQPLCSNSELNAEFHFAMAWSFLWTVPIFYPEPAQETVKWYLKNSACVYNGYRFGGHCCRGYMSGGSYSRVAEQILERREPEIEADQSSSSWKGKRFIQTWNMSSVRHSQRALSSVAKEGSILHSATKEQAVDKHRN